MSPCITERAADYGGFHTREFVVAGQAPTVVFFHGFGDSADTWRAVLERLGRQGQSAVAVDLPGFGRADRLRPGPLLPQLDAFAAAVVGRYGVAGPVVVAGNSLGGAVAVRAARSGNPAVGAVLAIAAVGHGWTRLTGSTPMVSAVSQWLFFVTMPKSLHRRMIRWALSRLLYGQRTAVDTGVVAAFADTVADFATARRLLHLGAQFVFEVDGAVEHGGVNVPMIVLHGTADRLIPVSSSHTLHRTNPGSRLVVLDRIGHCPQLDSPDAVATHAHELVERLTRQKELS